MFICTEIKWDTDNERAESLPSKVVIDLGPAGQFCNDNVIEGMLSDTLLDHYGFCQNGFQFEKIEVII